MRPSNSLIAINNPSQTASVSMTVWATDIVRCSLQVTVSSGSLNGTIQMQGSNDVPSGLPPSQYVPTNWNTITSATVVCSNTVQGAGTFMILPIETSYEYLRFSYTPGNSGNTNGTYVARLCAKAL
jgi:hypothetical protein